MTYTLFIIVMFLFYYYILKLYLPAPRGEKSPWTNASHWRQKVFTIFLGSFNTSCPLTTHTSTSWVTHVLFVAMPLLQIGSTCVLFVATPMNSLQCTLFVATPMNSLQCTLFVATTMNLEYMCTVCGHKRYFVYNHISVYYFSRCKIVYTSPGGGEQSPWMNHF